MTNPVAGLAPIPTVPHAVSATVQAEGAGTVVVAVGAGATTATVVASDGRMNTAVRAGPVALAEMADLLNQAAREITAGQAPG